MVLSAGFYSISPVTSLYFSFFCLLASSVSNFHPDTRGRWWSLFYAYLFRCAMGREEHCKQVSLVCVGCAPSVPATLGLPLLTACVLSQCVLQCSGTRLLCWELSEVGPGLHALPRSKPLRFRFLGTPQRCRLGWASVLCISQIQAAQVTRCLVSAFAPSRGLRLNRLPCPCCSVFWVYSRRAFSGVLCVFSGELISGFDPPSRCQPSRIPESLG